VAQRFKSCETPFPARGLEPQRVTGNLSEKTYFFTATASPSRMGSSVV
jgi:hypothetical protein